MLKEEEKMQCKFRERVSGILAFRIYKVSLMAYCLDHFEAS